MARKVQAASITVPIQAHRQKPSYSASRKDNGIQKGRKSKLTESAAPAASPGRRTGRPAKTLDRPSVAKDAKPAKAPRRSKFAAATPAMKASAVPHEPAAAARPAAQWDHATDTVRFDWPAIEQMASRDGPHQGMAKLLIAARAQGVNSRWPL